ncbi:MAG: hydrolase [Pirellulales bacterium]
MSASDWLSRSSELMSASDTAVLVIDVQEKLIRLIPEHQRLIWNVDRLLNGARLFGMPVLATQQYPRGLGETVPEIAGYFDQIPSKTSFSCRACPELFRGLFDRGVHRLLLAGIETHVCVLQTAFDLMAAGFQVFVAVDATGSRHRLDREVALRRLEASGAVLTTTESALFEWCGDADCPEFSDLRQLVKQSGPDASDPPSADV